MQRVLIELPIERLPLGGIRRCQHAGASHGGGGGDGVVQARDVQHGGHLGKAALGLAHQLGIRAVERDFAGGHGSGAQFVLQAVDPVAVPATVGAVTRHQEQREASRAGGSLLGTRQREGDLAADVRTEELLAE